MRKLLLLAVGVLALSLAAPARADVQVRIRLGLPTVLPPLVEVQPGVRVVQDYDEEIFFIGGYYWVQRDSNWYRTRDHRGTWRYVRAERLPLVLVSHHPGQYRRWQHDERRSWPDARRAGRGARHWNASDHRDHSQPQPERRRGRGHKDDKHEQRGDKH